MAKILNEYNWNLLMDGLRIEDGYFQSFIYSRPSASGVAIILDQETEKLRFFYLIYNTPQGKIIEELCPTEEQDLNLGDNIKRLKEGDSVKHLTIEQHNFHDSSQDEGT